MFSKLPSNCKKLLTSWRNIFITHCNFAYFQEEESYICIYSGRDEDCILFYHAGGIDIGNVEEKAELLKIPTVGCDDGTSGESIPSGDLKSLLKHLNPSKIEYVYIMILFT